jgi:tetratricopeptide (TPR) repeat protein
MPVSAWQDELPLKTYLLGPDDPNPPWHRTGMSRVYPYPMQDNLTDEVKVVHYKALHLENEYLHLIVLPQLGGRVYSLYDKIARREVFYRNNVVKYGLVARRGAWISGGIEFNFPQGHTCVTVSPVSSAITQDPETGGASIHVGAVDRVSRMRWSVRLSLLPGEARLRQDVMLHNPRPIRQRHYFWANSAVPATDDLHLIYPATQVRTLGGVHSYPICDGRDLSWYKNHERPNDIFCLNSAEDFFGCYYEKQDVGLVHWSDHRLDFGKKFFTWGTADEGMIWVDLLTDTDGQYVELQSGRFVDQATFEFLAPFQKVGWTEYWYPLHGMGGFVFANEIGAVNLKTGKGKAEFSAMVTRDLGKGELAVTRRGQFEEIQDVELRAGQPVKGEWVSDGFRGADALATVSLYVGNSQLIFYSQASGYVVGIETSGEVAAVQTGARSTPEEMCVQAVRHEKRCELEQSRDLYSKALKKDPGVSAAHLGLGLLEYQAAKYSESIVHLGKATSRDPENDEAAYYLALAYAAEDEKDKAKRVLWRLMGRSARQTESRILLAILEIRSHHHEEALALLTDAPDNPTVRFLRSVCRRRVPGTPQILHGAAFHRWEGADDPVDANLAAERYLTAVEGKDAAETQAALHGLLSITNGDPEPWLDLFLDYRELGFIGDAHTLLRLGCENVQALKDAPMPHYYQALGLSGDRAVSEFQAAFGANKEYCFPSRTEEIVVLESAIRQNPRDWKGWLYLGNLLACLDRRAEALKAWLAASSIYKGDGVVCRNIALAYSLWHKDYARAKLWYDQAVSCRPEEYHLYLERDNCLRASGATAEQRLEALASAPDRWEIAARRADCLVQLERWDEAVQLMKTHKFKPWEGARQMHALWTRALVGRAERHRKAGDLHAAVANYELALTYPRDLGVGRAACPQEAKVRWLLAQAAGEAGDSAKRDLHLRAAAEEKHLNVCEADVCKLRALRALTRRKEADELAEKLRRWCQERLKQQPEDALVRSITEELGAEA